jgi:hypothetical protein
VAKDKDDAADDKNHRDDDDQNDKDPGDKDKPPPPPGPPPPPPSQPPPGPPPTSGVSVTQTIGRRWPGRRQRYAQAEYQPADLQSAPASYSTGPGAAEEYHWHRTPTYHHEYAAAMATDTGMENNPT